MRVSKTVLCLLFAAACGDEQSTPPGDAPTVTATSPVSGAVGVADGGVVTATFSRAMDAATLTASTFQLRQGAELVPGEVTSAGAVASLTPKAPLGFSTTFSATISAGAKAVDGVPLAAAVTWTFTTRAAPVAPEVTVTSPPNAAVNVWNGQRPTAKFSVPMSAASLNASTFRLTQGATVVAGSVSYDPGTGTATFAPAVALGGLLPFVATVSSGATSADGIALAAPYSWVFTTRTASGATPVDLGTAGNYVILAQTKISTVPTSAITGDIAISPAAASYITGFSLTADVTNTSSTSSQVTGFVFAADNTLPTASKLTTAIGDMGTAFTDAAGRAPDVTELAAGDVSGMTLTPGVYKWSSGLLIATNVTLNGSATDVWIFEIAQNLTMASAQRVVLAGGALAKNIFWQVSGLVEIGTTSHFEGVVLCQTAITMRTGASLNGRLLAQSAVNLDANTIVQPAP